MKEQTYRNIITLHAKVTFKTNQRLEAVAEDRVPHICKACHGTGVKSETRPCTVCSGNGQIKRKKRNITYEEDNKDFRKVYKGDRMTTPYKQLISQSTGKTLKCDAHGDNHEDCEFNTEILKYFEQEIDKIGLENIKHIVRISNLL